MIAGDFNFPDIGWETSSSHCLEGHLAHMFFEVLSDCFFAQHIKSPTRLRFGSQPSVLGLVITNEEGMVTRVEYLLGVGASDHLIIRFNIACYTMPWLKKKTCKKAIVLPG